MFNFQLSLFSVYIALDGIMLPPAGGRLKIKNKELQFSLRLPTNYLKLR